MSETRFKAAYSIDVTSVMDELDEKFKEWGIEVLESDPEILYYKLVAPWELLIGEREVTTLEGNKLDVPIASLQIVLKKETGDDFEKSWISFNPSMAREVVIGLQRDNEELLKYIFKDGYCDLCSVAYVYTSDQDEPMIR
jgi:hypothetical protein